VGRNTITSPGTNTPRRTCSRKASPAYKQAIDRKPGRVKYRMAMDQQGNALLEELYTNYRFADGNDSLSIYKFLEAEKWRNYLKPYINTSRYEGFLR
jgi:hypothetical protein